MDRKIRVWRAYPRVGSIAILATLLVHLGMGAVPAPSVALGPAQLISGPLTFTVNSTLDANDTAIDGVCATSTSVCTLRAAMQEANAQPGHDTINFNIAGAGVHTINIATTLPILSDQAGVTVDGYTQPGSAVNTSTFADNAVLTIEIAGDASLTQDGFFIQSPSNVIRGLSLDKLRRSVWMTGPLADHNLVEGNFIGTNPAGTYGAPTVLAGASGVVMQGAASFNQVGVAGLANRNVISGNSHQGVALYDNGTFSNTIQNNIIGLNPAGTARLGNRSHGVDINEWTTYTLVGGSDPGVRNVISGNYQTGVEISHNSGTLHNMIVGNWIGTSVDGQSAPAYTANPQFAVRLEGHDACSDPCTLDQGFSQVINNVLAQGEGGVLADKGTHDATIAGNYIGVLPNGTPAGALVFGVRVEKGALNNTVGPGNIIADNAVGISTELEGINPASPLPVPTYGNKFTQNSIYDNAGLGIDIEPLGHVNVNDVGDADTGANTMLNYPEYTPTNPAVVNGTACASCTVEVFLSDRPNGSFGEGKTYLTSAVADGSGNWSALLPVSAQGQVITTTATDPANNTSEFSVDRTVPVAQPTNVAPTAGLNVSCAHTTCTFDASTSNDPDGSVLWYAFNFGDGTTASGTQAVVTHHYAGNSTPAVSVTVTDNDAATGTASSTAHPTNLAPTAAFTPACTFQVCSFDATASSDSDGTIASYAWDFGDSSTGTGTTISHTYTASGTFNAKLVVTDNDGSTGQVIVPISVTALPPLTDLYDNFTRTVANGWGTAPIGGAYTNGSGEAASFSVAGGVGKLSVPTAGASRSAWQTSISERDVDITTTVSTGSTPTGTGFGEAAYLVGRRVALNREYRGRIRFGTNGSVYAAVSRYDGTSTENVIGPEVVVPGLTYAIGKQFRAHLQISGINPTTIRLRVWAANAAEPSTWNVTTTDATAALQTSGAIGVNGYLSGTTTGIPVVFSFDDMIVSAIDTPPVPSFTSSCVNHTCTFDASASTDPDGTVGSYAWDFGDGATTSSSVPTTSHTYTAFATYPVVLKVADNRGVTTSLTQSVTPTNVPPVSAFTVSCANNSLACTFNAASSTDPDGTITSYAWDFQDLGATGTGVTASHTFSVADTYTVALTVTDSDGAINVSTQTFTVLAPNVLPTAAFTSSCTVLTCTFDGSTSTDSDGQILNYSWAFSDSTSDTGATVSHTFAQSGTYTATLTVTDDRGGSGSVPHSVSVLGPNVNPTAAFTVSCALMTCSVNGSTSSDPDGTIASYAWNFGDGTAAGSGATTSHTYGGAGQYTITLTVTDDRGGTATTTNVGSATLPGYVYNLAADDFTRTVASGWGNADLGGAYTLRPPATLSVSSGRGRVTVAAGAGKGAYLMGVNAADTDSVATFTTDKAPTGSGQSGYVLGRIVNATNEYGARVRLANDFKVRLGLVKFDNSASETLIGTELVIPGITYAANTDLRIRLQVEGANPTTLRARVWLASAAEPTTWQLTTTDTATGLQTTGGVGLHVFASSSVTNGPITGSFDAYRVTRVNQAPVAAFTQVCTDLSCTFSSATSTDPDGTIASTTWNFGDAATSTLASPTHAYAAAGTYPVILTVTDNKGLASSITTNVTVLAPDIPPVANFSVHCVFLVCTFDGSTSTDSDGTIASYAWNFGDTTTGTGVTTSHTYTAGATYQVSLTATDNRGGTNTKTMGTSPVANLAPTAAFTVSCTDLVCNVDGSTSTDSDGTIASYAWNFGDTTTGTGVTASHTYLAGGTDAITLTVTDDQGATGSVSHSVSVLPANIPPTAAFTYSCTDLACTFNGSTSTDSDGTIATYAWNFGDGNMDNGATPPAHTYAGSSTNTVTLTVTDNRGGTNTTTQSVAVLAANVPPVAAFTYSCTDLACTFNGSTSTDSDGTIASYAWTYGDGGTDTGATPPAHTYAGTSTNTVTLTVTDNRGGTNSTSQSVSVQPANVLPTAAFTYSCTVLSCTFDGSTSTDSDGTIVSYAWTYGDGGTDTGATPPAHVYAGTSSNTVTLTVTDNRGGTNVATQTVAVLAANAPPVAAFTTACPNLTCTVNGSTSTDSDGTIVSYAWTYGDGGTDTGATPPAHTYAATGSYTVTLTVTDDRGGTGTITHDVLANVPPVAAFTFSCTDLTCTFDGSTSTDPDEASIASYAWTYGDGGTDTGATPPAHVYAGTSTNTVTLTVTDARGATNTSTQSASVLATNVPPVAAFTTACPDLSCTVNGSTSTDSDGTIVSYAWTYGDGGTDTGATPPAHLYAATATYTITLTVTDDRGGTNSVSHDVSVQPANVLPTAAFTFSCTGVSCTFNGSTSTDSDGTIASYAWTYGDGGTDTGATPPAHVYAGTSTNTVTLTVTDNRGGTNSSSQSVAVVAANVPPTAAFTVSCTNLACTFNGATSTDSDGTIASYAWNFSDGATATGATASHTYTVAGVYPVTLVVTDNQSATGSVSHPANAQIPPFVPTSYATDSFTRTVASGWGSATTGGAWTANSAGSVNGSAGKIVEAAAGGATFYLAGVSSTDTSTYATVSTDKVATSNGQQFSLVGRRVSATAQYRGRIRFASTGQVFVAVTKLDGTSSDVVLGSEVVAAGLTQTAGAAFRVRVDVFGTNPTRIRVKVWPAGQPEPAAWNVNITDASAAIQVAGNVGVSVFIPGATTNGPITFTVDDFLAQGSNSAPVALIAAPVCTGLACTFSGTTSSDPDDAITAYAWSYGDGATGTGATSAHTYLAAGTYTVTLTVTDARGASSSVQTVVTAG